MINSLGTVVMAASSALPAILTTIGVCGVRILWIQFVFPAYPTFRSIMTAYPISLATTTLMVLTALIICHPSLRRQKAKREQNLKEA